MPRTICVVSGKGGVGKTTTSINLGASFTYFGKKAVVVDANITTPNVGLHLGVPIVPVTLHDVLKGQSSMPDAVYQHKSGMLVVPASIALHDLKKINPNKLSECIAQLTHGIDYIVIDAAAGLGREALASIRAADAILIVTNPEMPSITDALKTVKLCEEINKPVMGVVVTKTNAKNYDMSLQDIEQILELPIIGVIPEDRAVKKSLVEKEAVVNLFPKSPAAVQYKRLTANLLDVPYNEKIVPFEEQKSFLRKLFGFLN